MKFFLNHSFSTKRAALLAGLLTLAIDLVSSPHASAADAVKSWSGTWNNNKYKTTGALTCTVIGEQNGQWIAKFTGTGLGKPFSYTALITAKPSGGTTSLQGTSKIDGDTYQWSGSISGLAMAGKFQSGSGNNGEFRLQAKK